MSALKLAPVAAVVCAAACGAAAREFPLAASPSAAPIARPGALRAGFGRADITPPPGVGLNGNGFEGQQARGYRHRLYARALALESPAGERVVLVVADLGQMSALLQRRTADRLSRVGIGADRLMLSVTHTHSAPGNFYESSQYNAQAGAFPGYDSAMVEFLVTHLASAASAAVADLAPAKAAWGAAPVPGVTRNRSLDALLLDPEAAAILAPGPLPQPPDAAHDSTLMRRAVNDTLLMLRVDRCSQHWDDCRPRGAFSVFAVHGTVYPPVTDLLDGDVQALVERALERHIDSTGSAEMPQAFHLVANGTEGDVSPDWPAASRCAPYLELRAGRRPAGPRTPAPPEEWRIPDSRVRACLRAARRSVDELGTRLGTAAIALYERIGAKLSAEFPIARAFTTINLTHVGTTHRLCPPPLTGTANFAGAEDGQTRLYGWKFAWLLPSGIEEGGHAVDRHETSCQTPKRIGLGGVQKLLVGRRGLPQYAQLAVLRLGNAVLAAVPGEVTTVAGIRMKRALQDSGPAGIELAGVVGLANGYLQYIPTAEEYRAQDYEGGSAIYGPNTAAALTEELATL
ncbi:MAG TPA: neutral/alkaline non-lysosomal ceramidase N-terminal domain-containing protein, partial [Gemmatimonadales bacterium]|nr:neutral/alkaline non-lysosomal ceramidase N-terminal domain-containing protein [Gemmatimonadales bacterium]